MIILGHTRVAAPILRQDIAPPHRTEDTSRPGHLQERTDGLGPLRLTVFPDLLQGMLTLARLPERIPYRGQPEDVLARLQVTVCPDLLQGVVNLVRLLGDVTHQDHRDNTVILVRPLEDPLRPECLLGVAVLGHLIETTVCQDHRVEVTLKRQIVDIPPQGGRDEHTRRSLELIVPPVLGLHICFLVVRDALRMLLTSSEVIALAHPQS